MEEIDIWQQDGTGFAELLKVKNGKVKLGGQLIADADHKIISQPHAARFIDVSQHLRIPPHPRRMRTLPRGGDGLLAVGHALSTEGQPVERVVSVLQVFQSIEAECPVTPRTELCVCPALEHRRAGELPNAAHRSNASAKKRASCRHRCLRFSGLAMPCPSSSNSSSS